MTIFIELERPDGGAITLNVDHIVSVYPAGPPTGCCEVLTVTSVIYEIDMKFDTLTEFIYDRLNVAHPTK